MRMYTLVCVLAFCACKPHPGAALHSEQARHAVVEINQALISAQTLHAAGDMRDAEAKWSEARATYNAKLREGVSFHHSSHQALKVSYLLGRIANELQGAKGNPQVAMLDLTTELEEALVLIPDRPMLPE